MPGDGKNPKLQIVIDKAKAVFAPAERPNTLLGLIAFIIALGSSGIVILCELAPPSQHIEKPIEIGFLFLAAVFWIVTFKQVRGQNASDGTR